MTAAFLALPPELRNRVYLYLFICNAPAGSTVPVKNSPLALALTCRQLHHETHALAFPATVFPITCWSPAELLAKVQRLRPELRPAVNRLELAIGVSDLLKNYRSLDGLRFAAAGLTGLKELRINFSGGPQSEDREAYIRQNLEIVLWKTVAYCNNRSLTTIRLAYHGATQELGIAKLSTGMELRLPFRFEAVRVWEVRSTLKDDCFELVQNLGHGFEPRVVLISLVDDHPRECRPG